jgi:hypothetical protein
LQHRVVAGAAHASDRLDLARELHEELHVPFQDGQRALVSHAGGLPFAQEADAELQRTQRLAPFVGGHTVEFVQARGLIGDGARVEPHEHLHGGLGEHADRLVHASHQLDGFGG